MNKLDKISYLSFYVRYSNSVFTLVKTLKTFHQYSIWNVFHGRNKYEIKPIRSDAGTRGYPAAPVASFRKLTLGFGQASAMVGRFERVGEIVADFSHFGAFWTIISIQKGECR